MNAHMLTREYTVLSGEAVSDSYNGDSRGTRHFQARYHSENPRHQLSACLNLLVGVSSFQQSQLTSTVVVMMFVAMIS